jgi:arylsulfatase
MIGRIRHSRVSRQWWSTALRAFIRHATLDAYGRWTHTRGFYDQGWFTMSNTRGARSRHTPRKTVVVSLDTVSASRLSTLGSTRSTPSLDQIAAESALFTQAYATDIPTQPSHTAMFTGSYGATSGIVSHFHDPAQLDPGAAWMPSKFQAAGCRTGAVDHLFVMKDWFVRGYDDYIVPPGRSRSPASMVNDLAFPWLDAHANDDFFLFLHYWDAHIPYVPAEPFRTRHTWESRRRVDPDVMCRLQSRPSYPLFKRTHYDHLAGIPNLDYLVDLHYAEVAYLDHELGRLFAQLADLGVLDDCLIVIFGDHGENMTEHDAWFDHAGLYDSVVHVPLIIRAPGRVEPTRIDGLVALIDVLPTVLELQGLGDDQEFGRFDGRSLLPVMAGETAHHREAIMLSECTWQAKRGIRTRDWKYIRCRDPGIYPRAGCELYDLAADPDEQQDLSMERPETVAAMDALMNRWLDAQLAGRPDPMDEVIEVGLPAVLRLERVIDEDRGAGRGYTEEPQVIPPTGSELIRSRRATAA